MSDHADGRDITVRKGSRMEDGSCNGCLSKDDDLTVVELRTLVFRLCATCRKVLARKVEEQSE